MNYEQWKKRKAQGQATASASKPQKEEKEESGYEKWKRKRQETAQSEAAEKVNQWLSESQKMSNSYKTRYGGKKGRYRSDADQWLQDATGSRDALRSQALDIGKYLEDNRHILGDTFVAEVADVMRANRKFQSSVVSQAQREKDYYSQWENEDAYNADMKKRQEYEAKRTYDTKAGKREVDQLENALKEYQSLSRWETDEKGRSRLEELKKQYGDEKGIRDLITQKNAYLTEAERIQKGDRLSGVGKLGSEFYDPEIRFVKADAENQDVQYRYINDEDYRRQYQQMLGGNYDILKEAGLEHLTEDEKRTYNYYYAKGGKEQAQEYLNSIREQLNYRRADEMYEGLEDNTLLEMAFGIEAGIDQWQSGMSSLINNQEGAYMAPSARQIASGMVREDLTEKGKLAQGAYDVITTTANMAPSILTSTVANILAPGSGAVIGSAMMGASAGGSAYQEMINAGYSKNQARTYGVLVGASESILGSMLGGISKLGGKVSGQVIGNLMNKVDNVIARTAIKIGGNMLSEGFEEGLQEMLTPWFKSLLTGEEYAAAPEDVLYAGLLGALSAGLLEGPTTIAGQYGTYQQGKELKDAGIFATDLIDMGRKLPTESVAHQLAGRMNENTGAYTMGRMFKEAESYLTEQNIADIRRGLEQQGVRSSDAEVLANTFAQVVLGKAELTEQQMTAIEANDVLARTVQEVVLNPDSTVNQRSAGYRMLTQRMDGAQVEPVAAENPNPEAMPTAAVTENTAAAAEGDAEAETNALTTDRNTYQISTKRPINPQKVTAIEGETVTLQTDAGETVNADDIQFGDEDYDLVFHSVTKAEHMTPEAANTILQLYDRTGRHIDAQTYSTRADMLYQYGYHGVKKDYVIRNSGMLNMLSGSQAAMIYDHGRKAAALQTAQRQAAVETKKVVGPVLPGKVHFDGDRNALTDRQKVSLDALDKVADVMGIQIHIFESEQGADGKRIGDNGWFDPKDNSIHIDLKAGTRGADTMLFTASHELTHVIKKWSPEKFKTLSDFLFEAYGDEGVDVEALVHNQIRKARKNDRTLDYDGAFEEVVADAMETMLADGSVIERLEELKTRDRGLWEKVRDYILDLAARIKKFYEGVTAESVEGRYVADMKKAADRLQELFAEGLSEAGTNYQAAMERGKETQKNTADEGGVMYSIRKIGDTGMLYVQADRQVLSGNDPDAWGKQIEKYINEVIRKEEDIAIPTQDGHVLLLTGRSAYKLKDRHVAAIQKKVEALLSDEAYALKGRAATHIDELIQVARFDKYEPDKGNKHENDIGEDGFTYYEAGFRDLDGKYYRITFSAGVNAAEETMYSIGRIRQRSFPADRGSSSKAEALKNSRKASENIIYTSTDKSQAVKSAIELAFEKAQKEKTERQKEIMLSKRTGESVSNRALLAGAFDSVAQTESEKKLIQDYREKTAAMDEQEQKLQNLKKQIRELSFAKGPRDKEKIQALRQEAEKTANRISIYDRQLLRLEGSAPLKAVLEREKQKAYRKAEERGRAALEEHRKETEAKQQEIRERYQKSRENNVESRKRTAERQKLRKKIMDLRNLLERGTKKRNVKEGMRDFVEEAMATAEVLFIDHYSEEDMVREGVGCDTEAWESQLLDETQKLMQQQKDLLDASAATREVEQVIAGDTKSFDKRMEESQKIEKKIRENMRKLKGVFARERNRLNKATVDSLLDNLAKAYKDLGMSDDMYVRGATDEMVYQHLLELKDEISGTIVRDMSSDQLRKLNEAYTMVLTTVRNANKLFGENLKKSREELGRQTIAEVRAAGGEHGLWKPGEDRVNTFSWNNQKPVYAFERIGSDTLLQLYEGMRSGEDTWARNVTEAKEFFRKKAKEFHYDSWDMTGTHKFTANSGAQFELNTEQIMSIYAYSRREQALDHLLKGGFVYDGNTEVQVDKFGVKLTYLNKSAKAHGLSLDTLMEIVDTLTPEQKAFVEQMQSYLSDTMGGKGNEVSMRMYGVKLFKEKFYFPLRSAGQYMEKAREADLKKSQGQTSIANSGFAKAVTPRANNPVVLSGFMDVWASHVNEMSMYHAFVLPMEDFRRIYNFNTSENESVISAIQNAYGDAATGYIDQLYRDLNGGAVTDPRENLAKSLMGKFKKAAVFASASVVIQQPSAVGRAFALVDPKYFIGKKVDQKRHKALWEEVKQHAPVAMIKEMGYFDTHMGRSAQDFITAAEYNGIGEKTKALFADGNYRDEVLSKLPALADELTWCMIWDAVKRETKDQRRDLVPGTDAFLDAAGKRFTEVVTRTQVYDSVLARSGNMRSKSAFMNMWTAFMAEPTTSINMLEDAVRKGRNGEGKKAARIAGAVYTSVLLNSMLVSLVYAARDDDEDETFIEKYVQSFSTEMLDGLNPITYYPFLKDVWSAMQGFDLERSDMSLITKLTETLTKTVKLMGKDTESMSEEEFENHQKQVRDNLWSLADHISSLAGVPVKNIRRDALAVKNFIKTVDADTKERDTSWGSLLDKTWDVVRDTIPIIGWMKDETKADKLYDAIIQGDTAYVKRLNSSYDTESALNTAIRKGLRDNDIRITEAAIAWNEGDMETYLRIAKDIIGEGKFSQDNVVLAIRAEADAMVSDEESTSAAKLKGYFTADKFAVAVAQGNDKMADIIRGDIIETAQRNGKTAEDAEKDFNSSGTANVKTMFLEGKITKDQAVRALRDYCGKTQEKAEKSVSEWAFQQEYGYSYDDRANAYISGEVSASELKEALISVGGMSEEDALWQIKVYDWQKEGFTVDNNQRWVVKNYETHCEPAGISKAIWMDYVGKTSSIEGNGKKEELMKIIDSLPLTDKQKDAIYYAEGYAKSRIDEAPWH